MSADFQQSSMVEYLPIDSLKPHPMNLAIYGEDGYQDLIESIKELGVMQALYIMPNKVIISGHRRWYAAREAGLTIIPTITNKYKTELDIRQAIIEHNRYRIKNGLQLYNEGLELEKIEGERSEKVRLTNLKQNTEVEYLPPRGKTRDIVAETIGLGSGRQWDNLKFIAENKPALLTEIKPHGMSIHAAIIDIRRSEKEIEKQDELKRLTSIPAPMPENITLIAGDIIDEYKKFKLDSIDAIITDPPYGKEYLHLYETLGLISKYLLKSDGFLLVMTGQSYVPEYINILSKYLKYWWTIAYTTPGDATLIWDRKIRANWKPIFVFVKNNITEWHTDIINSPAKDKRFMDWGQSESGLASLILNYTKENDTILDPFLGAGTTGLCAHRLNRKFIGIDINPEIIKIAKGRIINDKT